MADKNWGVINMQKVLCCCDVCGQEVNQYLLIKKAVKRRFQIPFVHLSPGYHPKYKDWAGYEEYDMCTECFEKLIDGIKNKDV